VLAADSRALTANSRFLAAEPDPQAAESDPDPTVRTRARGSGRSPGAPGLQV